MKMYAVIETGGKQYRVEEGTRLKVEKLDVPEGGKVVFDRVLLLSEGGKVLAGDQLTEARVEATVLGHGKGKKIIVFKYKPKKGYRRKKGHRQLFTEVRIDKILSGKASSRRTGQKEPPAEGVAEAART